MCAAVLVCGSWLGGCVLPLQDWDLIFLQSTGPAKSSPADLGFAFEEVRFPSANGKQLSGWFVPAASGAPLGTLLVHTGMRGNLDTYLPVVPWAVQNDFNILVYDWQGFGSSEGVPDFGNFEPDTRAAVEYLLSRPESATGIIQLGASLGAIPAMAATTWYPDQTVGLVLYGGFYTDNFAESWIIDQLTPLLASVGVIGDLAWNALLPDFFDARQYLDAIHVPIFSITPEDDTIVPVEEQNRFYKSLPEPKQRFFTYGGHVHSPETDPELGSAVMNWAKSVVAARNQP